MKGKTDNLNSLCDEANAFITNLTTLLKEEDIMTSLDESALELLGFTYDNYIKATRIIQEKGLTYQSERGDVKARPEIKIQLDSLIQLNKIMDSFGLSPKARKEIQKPKEKENRKSPIDLFIDGNKLKHEIKRNGKVRDKIKA